MRKIVLLIASILFIFISCQDVISKTRIKSSPLDKWVTSELFKPPKNYSTNLCKQDGFESLFYEGVEYKGEKTKVFAYFRKPAGDPPKGGWPAVICVHGGGGTAFPDWIQAWNNHGYAAIAMDLEGRLPQGDYPNRPSHENAGPSRIGIFGDMELPDCEQWFYHAVADVIKAGSLLASMPDINKNKIGMHGISWGGVITCTAIGIDDRLQFAISVYGCGYLHLSECPLWSGSFKIMSPAQLEKYRSTWDPSNYLKKCKIPVLFYNGTNDPHFPMDIVQKSALLIKGHLMLCLPNTNAHGHIWNQKEIFAFADEITRKGKPFLKFDTPKVNGCKASVDVSIESDYPESVFECRLVFTKDSGNWQARQWQSVPVEQTGKLICAELPEGVTAFYFNITTRQGLTYSSTYREVR